MSTFIKKTKNPKTKKIQMAVWIEDFFGPLKYAVCFRKDGRDSKLEDDFNRRDHDIYKEEEL